MVPNFVMKVDHTLNDVEIDKMKKLCSAADSDENHFGRY